MMNSSSALESLSSADLLSATRELVQKSRGLEAELLLHLGEVDERKLYLECAFPSMFAFCVEELGFSEDAAYARITVARAAHRLPAMVETIRSGKVHLTGLRMLVPHLTEQNHGEVLAQAAGKSKRRVEELVARLAAAGRSCADPQASRASGPCDGAFGASGGGRTATNCGAAGRRCPRRARRARTADGGDVQGPVHRQPRISGQAAAGAGPAPAPRTGWRPRGHPGKGTRSLDRGRQEGAVRSGPEGPAGAQGGCRQLATHSRCDQASGLRTRRRALYVCGRARPALQRDWSAGIRSRGRICAYAPARRRRDPAPLPRAQPARGRAALRAGLHGTSAGTGPGMLSPHRDDSAEHRDVQVCPNAAGVAENVSGAFFVDRAATAVRPGASCASDRARAGPLRPRMAAAAPGAQAQALRTIRAERACLRGRRRARVVLSRRAPALPGWRGSPARGAAPDPAILPAWPPGSRSFARRRRR